jgi:anthranilate/para-aminobenzoate synthase component II
MFEYLMKKAESENFSLKLRVEDKEVTIEGNDFNPETTLTETEDRALRFFMGERKNE